MIESDTANDKGVFFGGGTETLKQLWENMKD